MTPPVLLIAYGNPLRGDDGLAAAIASEVSRTLPEETVEILTTVQLLPEHAPSVADRRLVIFVDARAGEKPGTVNLSPVSYPDEAGGGAALTHHFRPAHLLVLASLFGRVPRALLLTVGASEFGYGGPVSASLRSALAAAAGIVAGLSR
ncbi:MAG: hydrogenase maturation protease [Thermoanaerobaculia bacterium]|nr:hydrogenase maturation protease [Thermoanaerobaculia bacterium]